MAGTLVSTILQLAGKAKDDAVLNAHRLYRYGKNDVAIPLYESVRDYYKENKDGALDYLKDKKDKAKAFFSETVNDISSTFNKERDLYLEGEEKPVIYAHRLRAGEYFNLKTSKPILTMNALLKCNGDIVDKEGNYVLTLEELMRGLYDVNGVRADTISGNLSGWLTDTKGKFKNWDDFVKRSVVPSNAEAAIKDGVSF